MKLKICNKYKMPEKKKEPKSAGDYLKIMKVGNSVLCTPKEAQCFWNAAGRYKVKLCTKKVRNKIRVWKKK